MEDIRCFQHCTGHYNIYCFKVPEICPVCEGRINDTGFRIPPYQIPTPFVRSENAKHSLLIKPTQGDFLTDFTNQSNLHIGVTNSKGCVYEFDEKGVSVGNNNWTRCLQVELIKGLSIQNMEVDWDQSLNKFKGGRLWKAEHYEEERHNCFDFVVGFLRFIGLDREYSCLIDRSFFCKEIILPYTAKAGQFISLYRNILLNGFVIKSSA